MNIEPMYLLIYYKKGKQRMTVMGRLELLRWIKENPNKTRATFALEQVQFSMADTYEVQDE